MTMIVQAAFYHHILLTHIEELYFQNA